MWNYFLLIFILFILLAYYWISAVRSDIRDFEIIYGNYPLPRYDVPGLTIERTSQMPYIKYNFADPEKKYTLMLVDSTAPSPRRPAPGFWRHWLLVDLSGKELLEGSARIEQSGPGLITHYEGPNPPVDSGRHTYHVQLYEQQGNLVGPAVPEVRSNWDLDNYIDKHDLYLVAEKTFTVKNKTPSKLR